MAGNFNISRFKSEVAKSGGLSRGLFFQCMITVPTAALSFSDSTDLLVCKAATIPTETLDTVELKYYTRSVRIPGARQFAPFTMTFYNTNSYRLREKFYRWMNVFNSSTFNTRGDFETSARPSDGVAAYPLRSSYNMSGLADSMATIQLRAFNNNGQMSVSDLLKVAVNTGISAGQAIGSQINPVVGSITDAIGNKFVREIDSNNPNTGLYQLNYAYPSSVSGLQFSYDDDGSYQTFDVEFQYLNMVFIQGDTGQNSGTAKLLSKVGL